MFNRKDILTTVAASYSNLLEYHRQLKSFYHFLDRQFAAEDYGVKLEAIAKNRLFTLGSDHLLYEDRTYPFDGWLTPWYGRFYLDAACVPEGSSLDDCSGKNAQYLAFVWHWTGCNDPNVADVDYPECWICVTKPEPDNPSEFIYNIAEMVWSQFRIELTCEEEINGWLTGRYPHDLINCGLKGHWFVRRIPLFQLYNSYQIQQLIVRPVCEQFSQIALNSKQG